jgi:hypothetical protein
VKKLEVAIAHGHEKGNDKVDSHLDLALIFFQVLLLDLNVHVKDGLEIESFEEIFVLCRISELQPLEYS